MRSHHVSRGKLSASSRRACRAGGADEEVRVGIAADDPMHHHDVGRVDAGLALGEIAVTPLDSLLGSRLAGEGLASSS